MFQGILFVLHTGIAWEHLPQERGFGSGVTCWRRLAEWTEAGVWPRLHEVLLPKLRSANALDFSRAAVDGSHIQALMRAPRRDEAVLIGAGRGSKHHPITDATGIPLAVTLTGGNRNDVTQLIPLLQAVPPVRGRRRRPRRRPDVVLGDRGYDHDKYRRLVWDLGVKPLIARRGTDHDNLHTDLTGTGVHAGLLQVAGMVGGSDSAKDIAEHWDPTTLPEPLDPADLADTCWDLYLNRDRFEAVVAGPDT